MLRSLYIRDYALIEELEVEFGPGLNIITGETGAGKSILIGALKMILGERASTEVVRSGARKAVIEGTFNDSGSPRVRAVLADNGIETQPNLILRREIGETQSRAFVNDTPATAQALRSLSSLLIDLHGQHEHQSLLRTETHLELLDNFGALDGLLDAYRKHYEEMDALVKRRRDLVRREQELKQQKDLVAFQIEEIDAVSPVAGEEESLEAERRVLENAEHLFEATSTLYQILYESGGAVYDRLVDARNQIEGLARIDPRFEEMLGEVRSAEIVVNEVAKTLQDYHARIEFNPERLEQIRERLGRLHFLKKKYGPTLEAILSFREEIGQTFDAAADFEGAIRRLDRETAEKRAGLSEAAVRLSAERQQIAATIRTLIGQELQELGIAHPSFEVRFETRASEAGWVEVRVNGADPLRCEATTNGIDVVEFFISTNLGEEARPLARVASGGEISRIMLALKAILARTERLPILVFDEIDSGISGAVAQRVGEVMRGLGGDHQIIAITHLPQIAAQGHHHFVVEKATHDGRTRTRIRRLAPDEREVEVATLLSGTEVTDAALRSARELLQVAAQESR